MFFNSWNETQVKQLFKKLAFRLHPDHGGSNELMILLQSAYDDRIKFLKDIEKMAEDSEKPNVYEKSYENIYSTDWRIEIVYEIIEYSKTKKTFCDTFVRSVEEFLQNRGYITCNQYNSLVKTYYAFEMNKKADEKEKV